jgi:hypothetical protein
VDVELRTLGGGLGIELSVNLGQHVETFKVQGKKMPYMRPWNMLHSDGGSYREEAHEIESEEKVNTLSEAVEANGQRGAVRVRAGQQETSQE